MKKSLLFLLFLLPAALFAQKAIEIKLWPDGAPNDNGILQAGHPSAITVVTLNFIAN